jgi:signal transduction histidine kinase
MSSLNLSDLLFIITLIVTVFYTVIAGAAIRKRVEQGGVAELVLGYAIIALCMGIYEALHYKNILNVETGLYFDIHAYGALLLGFMLVLIVQGFLRRSNWWGWVGAGVFITLTVLVFALDIFKLPADFLKVGSARADRAVSALLWAILIIYSAWLLLGEYDEARQPMYRNRIAYWLPVFILILLSDIPLFMGYSIVGNPFRLFAAFVMSYAVLNHDVADMRQLMRSGMIYSITTLILMAFYTVGVVFTQRIVSVAPNFNPIISSAIIALILSILFTPLLALVRRLVNNWSNSDTYDSGMILQKYSESISNLLEMQKLATVSVGSIIESMGLERGYLFIVDQDRQADGRDVYQVRAVRSPEERTIPILEIGEESPIAMAFLREARPLLQYDLNLLPVFRTASKPEQEWFKRLDCEVFLPVISKRKWIGLIALGPKLNGNRFTSENLSTLSALANQTAIALENARLVENLMRVNMELRTARREMERTNTLIQRVDTTKSDFISIASHELRTPLTVIKGYIEMLMEDPKLDPNYAPLTKGIHDGTLRLYQIMESMFDIAQINTRTRELSIEYVNVGALLRSVCHNHLGAIRERNLNMTIELPRIPLLKADNSLMEKLFNHLITNAIKFTPNQGSISITGRSIGPTINSEFLDGAIQITFSDTGVGVDPVYQELIFTKFYQSGELGKHSTSKNRFQGSGTGLGLSLCKAIVEAHGGRIWVESPGYDEVNFPGSKFHVVLPLNKLEEGEQREFGEVFAVSFLKE